MRTTHNPPIAAGVSSSRRRWTTLLALPLAVALWSCGSGGEPPAGSQVNGEPAAQPEVQPRERAEPPDFSALPEVRVTGGGDADAARRITEGCEPVEEASRYEALVGRRAFAILHWTGLSEAAAALRIPVFVVGIDGGEVLVRFLEFPAREEYLHVWLGSGHIGAGPEDVFRLDPCSATLEP